MLITNYYPVFTEENKWRGMLHKMREIDRLPALPQRKEGAALWPRPLHS